MATTRFQLGWYREYFPLAATPSPTLRGWRLGMRMMRQAFQTDTFDRMGTIPRVSPRVDDSDSGGDNIVV